MTGLPAAHLRLAVADCLRDPDPAARRLDAARGRLWREPPGAVAEVHGVMAAAYDAPTLGGLDGGPPGDGARGLKAEQMRRLRRPLPARNRRGMTVAEMAEHAGLNRETLACLLEHHGYLELVPFGGRQRRRLVTDRAFAAGLGHNADASHTRVARVEGARRAGVFPVFYPEHVPAILWTLDHPGIVRAMAAIPRKRDRLAWLLVQHGHLPTAELADLSGFSRRGIEKARERLNTVP